MPLRDVHRKQKSTEGFLWLQPSNLKPQTLKDKRQWLGFQKLPSFLFFVSCFLLFALPAHAAKLQFWRFDVNRNRLDFTTDTGVQPRAQLVANPTRLVIDLPGIRLERPMMNQTVGGTVQSVRVGQFDAQTTRIVIELAAGYTLDPQQIRVQGNTPSQWSVQLPTPQLVVTADPSVVVNTSPSPNTSDPSTAALPTPVRGETEVQGVQVTPDGFFVRTSGRSPDVNLERSPNGEQIQVTLRGTTISPQLLRRDLLINRFGVRRLLVTPLQSSPPITRITLSVPSSSPNWQASTSSLGGVVLVPVGGVEATTDSQRSLTGNNSDPATGSIATIQSIALDGSQLVIRADAPLTYTSGWDRSSGSYRITLPAAQLTDQVKGPQLDARSPLLRVRIRQEDPRTVVILAQPAAGVQVGVVNRIGSQTLALPLQRGRISVIPPGNVIVPVNPNPTLSLPTVPRGRLVVIIDPGHGGPDPGAVGIGGLQEKGIVMDISQQVAALLERQGVQAVMTRQNDIDLGLEPRVRMAERLNASLFVSIHANAISLSRPDINGLETYYFGNDRLARTIHNSVLQGTGVRDRGVRKARFYVLRKTSMPSVLVEVGFVTGAEDAARLANPAYRSQMAASIARGILQYIQQNR